ncbi:MAG: serine/threonine protein kinase [Labilithrix sp.]|nr:serine/threonine protein kinase [Labilithrix sp.]
MAARGPDLKPGALLPGTKYRVVKQLGAGGMGVVYQVVKPPEIQGVLKLMSTDLAEHEEFRTRFFDEVRVLAQLEHPNIVRVFDYDSLTDGTPYYVMELLHGRTLRDVIATMGTVPPRVAFEIARQLCEALHCAHTNAIPVIHRDIKPENIFLHAPRHGEPVVKLIDFGVVAVADRQHDDTFVGTWKYAAPEQIRAERATPATDIYAVGLVLYEMLCGIGPFEHCDSGELVSQAHMYEKPPPVSKFAPWVPPSIVALIDASLAKNPRQRPRDAYAFAERLFELEWANDGKDPHDKTSEGPLSRVLSTVGGAGKPSSKNMAAAPAKDRIGNVPLIGVPPSAKHDGPTLRGVGNPHEPTSPGEEALLAGLAARLDLAPRSKRERESGPAAEAARVASSKKIEVSKKIEAPTLDAPPSAPRIEAATDAGSFADHTTRKLAPGTYDSDTFASAESDARRAGIAPRSKIAIPIAVALVALIGAGSWLALRERAPAAGAASGAAHLVDRRPEPPAEVPAPPPSSASPSPLLLPSAEPAASAHAPEPTAKPARPGAAAKPGKVTAPERPEEPPRPAAPASPPDPPKPAKTDDSFIRDLGGSTKP